MRFLSVVSAGVLLGAMSCARVPEEDQEPASSASLSTDANSYSTVPPDGASGPTGGLPPSKTVSTDTKVGDEQGSPGYLSAARFFDEEVDINSGDLRGVRDTAEGPLRYGIYESELSREVRRLGIPIPEERRWRVIYAAPGGTGIQVRCVYADLFPTARMLLNLLDAVNATDEERRAVLERLMTSLRTEKPPAAVDKGRMLIVEVADQHGCESPLPQFHTERLRQLSRQKAQ